MVPQIKDLDHDEVILLGISITLVDTLKQRKVLIFMKKNRLDFFNSRNITVFTILSFIIILMTIVTGNIYMNSSVEQESLAQQNRLELVLLGKELSAGSDYLTDEVRKFAITGELEHLYNFWHEVNVVKSRDNVITQLENYDMLDNEADYLVEAKKYSDELISIEEASMKMILIANDVVPNDSMDEEMNEYISYVLSTDNYDFIDDLNQNELRDMAVELLYDETYLDYKDKIMTPIDNFNTVFSQRLDTEVSEMTRTRQIASIGQFIGSVFAIFILVITLIGFNSLYIKPVKKYSNDITRIIEKSNFSASFSGMKLKPRGATELKLLGIHFNNLSKMLKKELEVSEKSQEEMRIAKEEADKANNSKSEFLASMSHELRTPLNAISGYLYLLEDTNLSEEQIKYSSSIGDASDNLLELISEVLDFSKIEAGRMIFEYTNFDLIKLVDSIRSIMDNTANTKGIAFKCELDENLPRYIKGDALRLRQLLINLIGNAIKFTDEGEVSLLVKLKHTENDNLTMCFSVKDSGIGIKKENLELIFQPFVQATEGTSRKYGGTGLGLAICKRIVEGISDDRYRLEIDSHEGVGSTFSFLMDFTVGEKEVKDKESASVLDIGKKVLLIDDNEINLFMQSEIIKKSGLLVDTALSGKIAIELTQNTKYDMILTDIRMPDMDGYETVKIIRKNPLYIDVPILALTADVVTEVDDKILVAGMNDIAHKPLKPEKLNQLIKKYFNISRTAPKMLITDSNRLFVFNKALQNIDGNSVLLFRLVSKFIKGHTENMVYVKSHIKSNNYGNATRILHNIIGVSGNLCCDKLSKVSSELKTELKNGTHDNLEEFMRISEATLSEMKDYLEANPIETSDENSGTIKEALTQILTLCNEFDISAVDILESNKNKFYTALPYETVQILESALQNYDFVTSSDIAEELIKVCEITS